MKHKKKMEKSVSRKIRNYLLKQDRNKPYIFHDFLTKLKIGFDWIVYKEHLSPITNQVKDW